MFVNGSGQNVQSLERTFYRCFIRSFSSFGWGVSEGKIKMWKVNGRQTMDAKWWQKLTLPLASWAKNWMLSTEAMSKNGKQHKFYIQCKIKHTSINLSTSSLPFSALPATNIRRDCRSCSCSYLYWFLCKRCPSVSVTLNSSTFDKVCEKV